MSTRRHFTKTVTLAGAAAFLLRGKVWSSAPVLSKFVQRLPGIGPSAANELNNYIPVAAVNKQAISGVDYYQLEARAFSHQMHPNLSPTPLWGYVDATTGVEQYLGPAIVARNGTPVQMTVTNKLPPNTHPLPVDTTLPGAAPGQALNRISVHLHGGFVPWISDGGPQAWFDAQGNFGPSFRNNAIPNAKTGAGVAEYYYPNQQKARLMWYHDHAMGITRLNAYAGLAAPYVVTDGFEARLASVGLLPPILGPRDLPLVIQDKGFNGDGSLFYPSIYDAEQGPNYNPPFPSCVPEAFFDTIVINGAAYPYVQVEPRIYRVRILNASQSRFYNLQLYGVNGSETQADVTKNGPALLQIGTEGGFLPAPVLFDNNKRFNTYNLLLAPAERADILIDFSEFAGATLMLYNDANAPFPDGDPPEENETANPDVRNLLQIRVGTSTTSTDPLTFNQVRSGLTKYFAGSAPAPLRSKRIRTLTLNEDFDEFGRLIQMLGTTAQTRLNADGDPFYGRAYMDPATEVVRSGSTEIWRIFNLTGDTHPIHFHLVNVQVLGRAQFADFNNIGPFSPPDPNEAGWKETVRMNPGEVTDVIANFALPNVPFKVPSSPMGGNEYVWHCHILEHEEHDMMRPLIVK